MIRRVAAQKRRLTVTPDAESFRLFSSGDYFEVDNVHWGGLRIFNDDLMQPGHGYAMHAHDEMEIVTILLAGELHQRLETGASSRLRSGDIQTMSAGRGIAHCEYNEGRDPVHYYQIGFFPRTHGLAPSIAQGSHDRASFQNVLLPIASGQQGTAALPIQTDSTVYISSLDSYHLVAHPLAADRMAFVYVTRGSLNVNGLDLDTGDQARIAEEEGDLALGALSPCDFVLIDTPPTDRKKNG